MKVGGGRVERDDEGRCWLIVRCTCIFGVWLIDWVGVTVHLFSTLLREENSLLGVGVLFLPHRYTWLCGMSALNCIECLIMVYW